MESMFTEEGKDEPGELSHEELFWMFKNLGLGLSSAEAKELVASVDADANGRVKEP
jgi:Ca2+-binding EF-hand superfamily protein